MKSKNVSHNLLMVEIVYLLLKERGIKNAIELGNLILELDFDNRTDGFWVLQIGTDIEYYSPKFREILGYEDEKDFPNVPKSWQDAIDSFDAKEATEAYEKHLADPDYPYVLNVVYNKKHGGRVALICSGTIVNRDEDVQFMIGTHELIK